MKLNQMKWKDFTSSVLWNIMIYQILTATNLVICLFIYLHTCPQLWSGYTIFSYMCISLKCNNSMISPIITRAWDIRAHECEYAAASRFYPCVIVIVWLVQLFSMLSPDSGTWLPPPAECSQLQPILGAFSHWHSLWGHQTVSFVAFL